MASAVCIASPCLNISSSAPLVSEIEFRVPKLVRKLRRCIFWMKKSSVSRSSLLSRCRGGLLLGGLRYFCADIRTLSLRATSLSCMRMCEHACAVRKLSARYPHIRHARHLGLLLRKKGEVRCQTINMELVNMGEGVQALCCKYVCSCFQ